jgi:hypothetical protein
VIIEELALTILPSALQKVDKEEEDTDDILKTEYATLTKQTFINYYAVVLTQLVDVFRQITQRSKLFKEVK